MPPSPLYNWLCVLHSASEILSHAASIRAAQIARANAELDRVVGRRRRPVQRRPSAEAPDTLVGPQTTRRREVHAYSVNGELHGDTNLLNDTPMGDATRSVEAECLPSEPTKLSLHDLDASAYAKAIPAEPTYQPEAEQQKEELIPQPTASGTTQSPFTGALHKSVVTGEPGILDNTKDSEVKESTEAKDTAEAQVEILQPELPQQQAFPPSQTQRNLQPSRVPSSRIGRLFHYGGLAASLGYGAASEAFRRVSSSQSDEQRSSLMTTPANIKRLVEKLSKMRGAALKLGQFMSIQDTHILPKDVEEVFRRVQDSAHYMPNWQMERVMSDSLGPSWESIFASFDRIPFAAASLGQVHSAVLAANTSPTGKDEKVAIKVQFPDIEKSIESDLGYLKLLLSAGKVLPKGLFLDKTLQVMKGELADECNYTREASCARFFASEDGLGKDERFRVPWVWEGSTERVLVMQRMDGVSVGGNIVDKLSQDSRDKIASTVLELCMKELFEFRMMQTDPNWSNFLWNEQRRQIELIDFGATRSYSKEFIDKWMAVLQAAVGEDYDACVHWSLQLGYLKGGESKTMLDAHIRSLTLLATPFRARKATSSELDDDGRYVFGRGTEWARITAEIRSLIPVMLRDRLTPPPQETYSLNRKLSGAFLLASRLGAKVNCRSIWEATVEKYQSAS